MYQVKNVWFEEKTAFTVAVQFHKQRVVKVASLSKTAFPLFYVK